MCFKWLDKKIKNLRWYDLSLIKLSVIAATLLIAKYYSPLLSLDWYWYVIIFIIAIIIPSKHMFSK